MTIIQHTESALQFSHCDCPTVTTIILLEADEPTPQTIGSDDYQMLRKDEAGNLFVAVNEDGECTLLKQGGTYQVGSDVERAFPQAVGIFRVSNVS